MKKQKIKFTGVISALIMLSIVTFSFAWMLELTTQSGHYIEIWYDSSNNNALNVANNDIEVSLYKADKNDNYEFMSDSKTVTSNPLCDIKNAAPGDVAKYSLKMSNLTPNNTIVTMSFADVSCENPLYNYVYFGLLSTIGFGENNEVPVVDDFSLSSKYTNGELTGDLKEFGFNFIDQFVLPANAKDVEIRFYIRIDKTANNETQSKTLTINNVVLNVI